MSAENRGDRPALQAAGIKIIAEISGNHLGDFDRAKQLIQAAKASGATHVKLQTYTPDTITLRSDAESFRVSAGHELWGGRTLYDLYEEAHTPWSWQKELFDFARMIGIEIFSSPFDPTAVDFLESLDCPIYKVASLETGDIGLLKKIASTQKPVILSSGATKLEELDLAVETILSNGCGDLTILLCTSAYPTPTTGVNLRKLETIQRRYQLPFGLSDHTVTNEASLAALALGATVLERHLTLARSDGGPDGDFSLEPQEFATLVSSASRTLEALGVDDWSISPLEYESRRFRRSLFVVEDVNAGDKVNNSNVRSIRPSGGMEPREYEQISQKTFLRSVKKGTPVTRDMFFQD